MVAILDEAFEGLALAAANAEKNLKNARELFDSYLEAAFTKGGDGWTELALDQLTEGNSPITYGVVKPGDPGDIRFVRGGDISNGRVRTEQLRTITKTVSDQYRRTLLQGGELLICLVGQPGQTAVAPDDLRGANIARQVGLIRLQQPTKPAFVCYFLRSRSGQKRLGSYTGGSVQQVINLADLRHVVIPLPDAEAQAEIVADLTDRESDVTRLEAIYQKKRREINELKQSLLAKAFAGDLT